MGGEHAIRGKIQSMNNFKSVHEKGRCREGCEYERAVEKRTNQISLKVDYEPGEIRSRKQSYEKVQFEKTNNEG